MKNTGKKVKNRVAHPIPGCYTHSKERMSFPIIPLGPVGLASPGSRACASPVPPNHDSLAAPTSVRSAYALHRQDADLP